MLEQEGETAGGEEEREGAGVAGKGQRGLGKENVGGCQEKEWWRMDVGRRRSE